MDARTFTDRALALGWKPERRGNGHVAWRHPKIERPRIVPASPSCNRAWLNAWSGVRRAMRAAGLPDPGSASQTKAGRSNASKTKKPANSRVTKPGKAGQSKAGQKNPRPVADLVGPDRPKRETAPVSESTKTVAVPVDVLARLTAELKRSRARLPALEAKIGDLDLEIVRLELMLASVLRCGRRRSVRGNHGLTQGSQICSLDSTRPISTSRNTLK